MRFFRYVDEGESEGDRKYVGFSNNVYGEVRHRLVNDIIRDAGILPHHTFLDMVRPPLWALCHGLFDRPIIFQGSGIGNVVLQVAAQCLCDCYGIEIMETPARLGKMQEREFLSRMRFVRMVFGCLAGLCSLA